MNNNITLKPLLDRVLVKPNPTSDTTPSGIYIPESAKEKSHIGSVVAVGEGKADAPMLVSVGQKVMYGEYAGTKIKLNGEDHLIMRMTDIHGIVA